MTRLRQLGSLESSVMEHLWTVGESQTVRQVHQALSAQRSLAYTTVMTVLRRLAAKNLAVQIRHARAHRYIPACTRDELVASLMLDALGQVAGDGAKHSALVHFVAQVSIDEMQTLRRALASVESRSTGGSFGSPVCAAPRSA